MLACFSGSRVEVHAGEGPALPFSGFPQGRSALFPLGPGLASLRAGKDRSWGPEARVQILALVDGAPSPVGPIVEDASGQARAHQLPDGRVLAIIPRQGGRSTGLLWDGREARTLPLPAGPARYDAPSGLVLIEQGESVQAWDVLAPQPRALPHDLAGLDWLVRHEDVVYGHVAATDRWRRLSLTSPPP